MKKGFRPTALVGIVVGAVLVAAAAFAGSARPSAKTTPLDKVDHIVVIYEENHSFDNLYGGWEGVNGVRTPTPRTRRRSTSRARRTPVCKQNDVNLAPLCRRRAPTRARLHERVLEHVVHDRHLHPGDRDDLPAAAAGVRVPERRAERHGPPGRLHA